MKDQEVTGTLESIEKEYLDIENIKKVAEILNKRADIATLKIQTTEDFFNIIGVGVYGEGGSVMVFDNEEIKIAYGKLDDKWCIVAKIYNGNSFQYEKRALDCNRLTRIAIANLLDTLREDVLRNIIIHENESVLIERRIQGGIKDAKV